MDSDGAVRHSRDDLTQLLLPHIAHSVDTGDIGTGIFIGQNIAALVQIDLTGHQFRCGLSAHADEQAVQFDFLFFAAVEILHTDAAEFFIGQQFRNRAVPAKFHIFRVFQGLVVDFRSPQGITAMDQVDFFRHTAQEQRIGSRGLD